MVPIVLTLFTNEHKYRRKWTIYTFVNTRLEKHKKTASAIKLAITVSIIVCYCISLIYTVTTISYLGSDNSTSGVSNAVVAGCLVLFCFLCSAPYGINFAMVSISQRMREVSFHIRGYRTIEGIISHKNLKAEGVAWVNMIAGMVT